MSTYNVRALNFREHHIGKNIAQSKKKYVWTLEVEGKKHVIELESSLISGKKKVVVDGAEIFRTVGGIFQYPFTISGHTITLLQLTFDSFDLSIGNDIFSYLYARERNNQEFKSDYESEFSNDNDERNQSHSATTKFGVNGHQGRTQNKLATPLFQDQDDIYYGGAKSAVLKPTHTHTTIRKENNNNKPDNNSKVNSEMFHSNRENKTPPVSAAKLVSYDPFAMDIADVGTKDVISPTQQPLKSSKNANFGSEKKQNDFESSSGKGLYPKFDSNSMKFDSNSKKDVKNQTATVGENSKKSIDLLDLDSFQNAFAPTPVETSKPAPVAQEAVPRRSSFAFIKKENPVTQQPQEVEKKPEVAQPNFSDMIMSGYQAPNALPNGFVLVQGNFNVQQNNNLGFHQMPQQVNQMNGFPQQNFQPNGFQVPMNQGFGYQQQQMVNMQPQKNLGMNGYGQAGLAMNYNHNAEMNKLQAPNMLRQQSDQPMGQFNKMDIFA